MIGREFIEISAKDFTRGMSSSGEVSDGGFSPDTDAVNLIAVPGILYPPASPTDKSTNLTGQIIASCEDPTGTYSRLFVSADADQDGRFYSMNSSNDLTARGSEDTSLNYVQGVTDMIAFKGEVRITGSDDIVRWSDIGGANTFDVSYMSATFGNNSAPHPALAFEDNAYYGDGNQLWRETTPGTPPSVILTLPTGSVIVALGIDPGSGKMLISYVQQLNASGTINTIAKVGFYDGFSNKLSRSVIVEEMITAFPNSEGVQYAAYGQNLGYWNGSGVSFLYRFSSIGYDNAELLYKHHFTSIGHTLYFIVDTQIIAHGRILQGGPKVFYPAFKNNVNSNNLTHIANLGSGVLGMSFATSLFYSWSAITVSTSNVTNDFITNLYRFPRPVQIRSFFIEYYTAVNASVVPGTLSYLNRSLITESGTFTDVQSLSNGASDTIRETQLAIDGVLNSKGRTFRFRFRRSDSAVAIGIARFIIYYDVVE